MAFNPHPKFLLRIFFVSLLAGTVVSLQAAPQGEPQAAAQDEVSLDNVVRQCDEAWHGRLVDAKKLCLAVLERADQLPDSNPKKARVLFKVVPIYSMSEDDTPQAISLLQRIVAIDETALGPEDPQVALDLRELGMQSQLRNPALAERSFKRAVTIAEGAQQMSSALRMAVFAGAAQFYRDHERHQDAETLLRRALELGDGLLPGQRSMLVSVRASLAEILRIEGKGDEADQLLAGPVPPGPASNGAAAAPDLTSLYNDLTQAREFKLHGRVQDAELHYRLVISALDRFPASWNRPYLDDALDELADLCHAQHRDAEAEDLLLRALHFREKKVSEQDAKTNPRLALILSAPYALENFYRDQGRLNEIEPVYKRAIEIQERYYRLTDDPVSDTLRNLASVYVEEKKFGEALPLYRHALQTKEKTLGANDPQLVGILEGLANTLQELGRTAEADKTRARAKQLSTQKRTSN